MVIVLTLSMTNVKMTTGTPSCKMTEMFFFLIVGCGGGDGGLRAHFSLRCLAHLNEQYISYMRRFPKMQIK